MAASDAKTHPRKNVAFRASFAILDNTGAPVSGAAGLDSEVSKDAGAFTDCTNEATEIGSSGVYYLDLTAGEMNADQVIVQIKTSTTDAKTTFLFFYLNGDIVVRDYSVDSNLTLVNGNISLLSSNLTQAGGNITQINGNVTLVNQNLSRSEANLTLVSGNLSLVAANVTLIGTNLSRTEANITLLNGNLTTVAGYIDTEVAAIKAKTDNLPASPAAVGSPMTLSDGAITDTKITLPTEATGTPSTALQLLMWIAGWFGWRKIVKNSSNGTITQYMSDSSTTKTTSTYTSASGVDTINKAS